jgi:hypothetical protein
MGEAYLLADCVVHAQSLHGCNGSLQGGGIIHAAFQDREKHRNTPFVDSQDLHGLLLFRHADEEENLMI